jgi:hypothetical protein
MRAIHNTFKQQLMLSEETFKYRLVSATSNGASVNTGCNNGLIKQLKDSHSWLLGIHCASHRLELAIKDSLMKNAHFKELHDFLVVIYYTFKKSGKLKGEFKRIGDVLGVDVKVMQKVHGTRFVTHQLRGLSALIHNWAMLCHCFENCIADTGYRPMKAKLSGLLKKLKDYRLLVRCLFFHQLLQPISLVESLRHEKRCFTALWGTSKA